MASSRPGVIRGNGEMADLISLAVEAGGLAVWYYDPQRNVVGGDERTAEFFGMAETKGPAEKWIGKLHSDDQERVSREFVAALEGEPYDTEFRICQGETTRWIRSKAQWGVQQQNRLIGVCEDITERKRSQAALQETSESLRLACATGRITSWDWNQLTGKLLWTQSEAVYGRPSK